MYLLQIIQTTSGPVKAIGNDVDYDAALMEFHQTLASAMANPTVQSAMCQIIDGHGAPQKTEYWERRTDEPE